jgi:hypothetical protein
MIIINYLIVGVICSFLLGRANSLNPNQQQHFDHMDRLWILLLWPIMVVVFIYYFIKSWFDEY